MPAIRLPVATPVLGAGSAISVAPLKVLIRRASYTNAPSGPGVEQGGVAQGKRPLQMGRNARLAVELPAAARKPAGDALGLFGAFAVGQQDLDVATDLSQIVPKGSGWMYRRR